MGWNFSGAEWNARTLRSWQLAILRFAVTLDNADRLALLAIAAELDDQVSCPLRSCVALDSETITRIPRNMTYCQRRPVNGPLATSTTALATTAPM